VADSSKVWLIPLIHEVHEGEKQFKCNICYLEKKNMKSVHEGIKPFKCKICEYKAGLRSNLKKHIETVHEGIKSFKCCVCDVKFAI
jgi:hypothetical protein